MLLKCTSIHHCHHTHTHTHIHTYILPMANLVMIGDPASYATHDANTLNTYNHNNLHMITQFHRPLPTKDVQQPCHRQTQHTCYPHTHNTCCHCRTHSPAQQPHSMHCYSFSAHSPKPLSGLLHRYHLRTTANTSSTLLLHLLLLLLHPQHLAHSARPSSRSQPHSQAQEALLATCPSHPMRPLPWYLMTTITCSSPLPPCTPQRLPIPTPFPLPHKASTSAFLSPTIPPHTITLIHHSPPWLQLLPVNCGRALQAAGHIVLTRVKELHGLRCAHNAERTHRVGMARDFFSWIKQEKALFVSFL